MEDLNSVLWCSAESLHNLTSLLDNQKRSTNPEKLLQTSKVFGFGTVAFVCTAMIVNVIVSLKFGNSELINYVSRCTGQSTPIRKVLPNLKRKTLMKSKIYTKILLVLLLMFISPLVILFLILAMAYKTACLAIIKWQDECFVKSLDSFDVFWSLEDDKTKSIINVLGVIESKSPHIFARNIKNKLETIKQAQGPDKIFYRKLEKYGFYYWQKQNDVDMDQYVKLINHGCNDKLTTEDLEDLMTNVESEALPYNDEGLFQILITNEIANCANTGNGEYGIIFRIHHSVGDGVALIHFLCGKLADKEEQFRPSITKAKHSSEDLVEKIQRFCEIPLSFADGILRQCDENSIHGPALSGRKLFKWTHSDENLLQKVKELKDKRTYLSFSGVLLVALSRALRDLFLQTRSGVPDQVATVIPIRFPKPTIQGSISLENDFTVAILNLQIKGDNVVEDITENCRCLSKSADPLTNYYFLRLVSVLPRGLLRPMLASRHATLVFSNLRGPAPVTLCGGELKSLVFFVPNKGTTGIGVTALTYGSVLRLGASADAALTDAAGLQLMLDGMTAEICRMHAQDTESTI